MLIYRFEAAFDIARHDKNPKFNWKTIGIYRHKQWEWKTRAHDLADGCPAVNQDIELAEYFDKTFSKKWQDDYELWSKYRFGFESINMLCRWFSDEAEIKKIFGCGGFFSIYNVDWKTAFSSSYQTIFGDFDATPIKKIKSYNSFLKFKNKMLNITEEKFMKAKYQFNCTEVPVGLKGEFIETMSRAKEIERETFIRNISIEDYNSIAKDCGYYVGNARKQGMKLSQEPYVSFYKSHIKKTPVYIMRLSATEYVFSRETFKSSCIR